MLNGRMAAACLAASLVLGCSENVTAPRAQHVSTLASEGQFDLTSLPIFSVTIRAQQIGATTSARVVGTVTANIGVDDADVSIQAPELQILREQGNFRHVAAHGPVGPVIEQHARLPAGVTWVLEATINAPSPGYYRLAVVAKADSLTTNAVFAQSTAIREIWLLVTDSSMLVTPEFEKGRVPAGMRSEAGPFRPLHSSVATAPVHGSQNVLPTAGDGNNYYKLEYYNFDTHQYEGIGHAHIVVTWWQDCGQGDTCILDTFSTNADADGRYGVYCESYPETVWYNGSVQLDYADANVYSGPYGGGSGVGTRDCGVSTYDNPEEVQSVASNPGHVFKLLQTMIPASRAFFNRARAHVSVQMDGPGSGSSYVGFYDTIHIRDDFVWGTFGAFTLAHEYGHALHNATMGGIPSHSCPSPHYIDEVVTRECAFVEGFADYHAEAIGNTLFHMESTDRSRGCTSYASNGTCLAYATTREGSFVEGAFGGMLLDLSDPISDVDHDHIYYPGSYVLDLISASTCGTTNPAGLIGPDVTAYCNDKTVGASLRDNYFSPRYFSIAGIYNPSTYPNGWSIYNNDEVVLWNLFHVAAAP